MKAAVLREIGQPLELEEAPMPELEVGEVLIRVEACGVCHSDTHLADGDWEMMKPITKTPLILGHEIIGIVEKLGESVTGLKPGDRVGVPWLYWTCGKCEFCKEGREVMCSQQKITGCTENGGFAEYVKAPASHALPIPAGLDPVATAPLLCAGLTVYRALKQAELKAGQRLAVVGVGGLGHLAIQIAKAQGAWVCGVDVQDSKLELAKECGADMVLNASAGPVHKDIKKVGGMHVVLVTSGSKAAYEAALRYLRRGGTLLIVGMTAQPISVSTVAMVGLEARIIASSVGTRDDLREMLALIAKHPGIHCHVETRPLSEINGIMDQVRRGELVGRVVIQP